MTHFVAPAVSVLRAVHPSTVGARAARPRLPSEALPKGVWHSNSLGPARAGVRAVSSGHSQLDAELAGGWPPGVLSELLSTLAADTGLAAWRLLAPTLASVSRARKLVVLVAPPGALNALALQAAGLALPQVLQVQASSMADALWATEQALRSLGRAEALQGQDTCTGVVLAWLHGTAPGVGRGAAPPGALRRLQLAASASGALGFVVRDAMVRHQPSPAPLRLLLVPAAAQHLAVTVLKRRGPPMARPLQLHLPVTVAPPTRHALRPVAQVLGLDEPVSDAVASLISQLSTRAQAQARASAPTGHP